MGTLQDGACDPATDATITGRLTRVSAGGSPVGRGEVPTSAPVAGGPRPGRDGSPEATAAGPGS